MIRHIAGVALVLGLAATPASAQPSLTVDGTEFVLQTEDGKTYRGSDLVGATLHVKVGDEAMDLRIDAIEKDGAALGGALFLYQFMTRNAAGGEVPLCMPDANRKTVGFPVSDGSGGFEITCTSGAIGKCLRWGYRPWDETPTGPPLRALHAACVRMVRADYGGDGQPTTIEGTVVYVCDRFGVRPCSKKPPLEFEAGWGVNGATCVARPRIPKIVALGQLGRRFPKLEGHLGSKRCDPRTAFRDPDTLLINRSASP